MLWLKVLFLHESAKKRSIRTDKKNQFFETFNQVKCLLQKVCYKTISFKIICDRFFHCPNLVCKLSVADSGEK